MSRPIEFRAYSKKDNAISEMDKNGIFRQCYFSDAACGWQDISLGNAISKRNRGELELYEFTGLTDKNDVKVYFDCEVFKFKFMESLNESIELTGVMIWNEDELRAEIDIHPEVGGYICLSYQGNGVMYDFEVIGSVYQDKHLQEIK